MAGVLPNFDELTAAAGIVHAVMAPTPQYCWPLICRRVGTEVWLKHENHTPAGAFKIRGGIVYLDSLRRTQPEVHRLVTATRGNHGQSVAIAATRAGLRADVYVPTGNSVEKNAAMRAQGANLIEAGDDFQAAVERAKSAAGEPGVEFVPSFHPALVAGVGSYAMELFGSVGDLDTVYVPVGMGSGACGLIAARDALGLPTRIVGVVATGAPAYALSIEAGHVVTTESADTLVDGVACRAPNAQAVDVLANGLERIVRVPDTAVAEAMRHLFADTHNVAEPAGAIAFAALMSERAQLAGRKVAAILTGGNVDSDLFAHVLAGGDLR